MRKMATIRKIDAINPIEGADAIEVATVGGWKVVIKKGEFKSGDLAVYCEIDSWIPTELAPFLSKGKEPREFEGIKGERLRTVKLRGQLSQGLLLPIDILPADDEFNGAWDEGDDVSEYLNIIKWEMPMNAQLAGVCKGNFPSFIPKTDQERVQNLVKEITTARRGHGPAMQFEVTEKLEGSSMTVYKNGDEFGVCSRNLDLKEDANNAFWKAAIENDIKTKIMGLPFDVAIQGELVGPGIQGNIYKLDKPQFFVFDCYNITEGVYFTPKARRDFVKSLELNHVPVLADVYVLQDTVDMLLVLAGGKSELNKKQEREGIVFKECNGGMSFKAISNNYLLKSKD